MKEEINYLNNLFNDNDVVIVSLSGGPDSMCLLDITLKVNKKIKIIAAHINHNVRKESKDEETFVKNFCDKKGIIFESMTINNYTNQNFHKEARDIRYNYMEQLINKYKAKYLLTAHHGDDLIESILMHLVRGTSFLGYSGFKKETDQGFYKLIRPLINKSKEEIKNYNIKNNIPFAIDKTNKSKKYTRNRYRLDVLPILHKENTKVIEKINKFSNLIIEYDDYVKKDVERCIKNVYKDNKLNISEFLKLDKLIQRGIIENILYKIYEDDIYLLNDRHIKYIYDLINTKKKNTSIILPKDINVVKEYNYLYFNKTIKENEKQKLLLKDKIENKDYIIKIVKESDDTTNNTIRLKKSEIKMPLYIINRENGLKINLKNGHRKINDIFIDCKLTKEKRDTQPILVDSDNKVLWIPGIKKSKFSKDKTEKCDIIVEYNFKGGNNYEK